MIEYRLDIMLLLIFVMLLYGVRKIRSFEYELDCVHDFVHSIEDVVSLLGHTIFTHGESDDGLKENAETIRKWDLGLEEE